MRKSIVSCGSVLAVLVLLFAGWASSQVNVSLSPLLHQLEMHPGQIARIAMFIGYRGEEPVTIRVFASDFAQSRSGKYKVLDEPQPDSMWSATPWINIKEEDRLFTINSGEERTVIVEVAMPRDLSLVGGRYTVLVFELLPEKIEEKPFIQMSFYYRMASFIEISIRGSLRKSEQEITITDLAIISTATEPKYSRRFGKDAHIFTASVTNEGNIHVEATGKLMIRNAQGRIIREVPLGGGRGVVLPGTTANFVSVLKDPRPGRYTAEAVLEHSQYRRPVTVSKQFFIGEKYAGEEVLKAEIPSLALNTESLVAEVPAGGFRSFVLIAENNEDVPLEVQISVEKFSLGIDGQGQVLASNQWSATDWLEVSPQHFTIPPLRSQTVRVGITVPSSVQGEKYAYLTFQTTKMIQTGRGGESKTRISAMIGVAGTLQESLEVVTANVSHEDARNIIVEVKNTGNTHVQIKGTVSVSDSKGTPLGEEIPMEGNRITVFPQENAEIHFFVSESLASGDYIVQVNLTFGKDDIQLNKEIPLSVK